MFRFLTFLALYATAVVLDLSAVAVVLFVAFASNEARLILRERRRRLRVRTQIERYLNAPYN